MNRSVLILLWSALFILISCNTNDQTMLQENDTNSMKINKNDSIFYINEGAKLARKMYAEILQNLNKALDELGYYESIRFCNLRALPIVDSLSKQYGIKAKRTSLKLRNPANAPDSIEKQVLLMYEKTQSKKPIIIPTKEGVRFFTPIYIAQLCLNCHGVPYQDIPDVTMKALDKWYPNDQAKNYQIYDIRGIWSITFPSNYSSKLNN